MGAKSTAKSPTSPPQITAWNLTNAEEVLAGATPAIVELPSPITLTVHRRRLDAIWEPGKDIVGFTQWLFYTCDIAADRALLQLPVTTVNLPLLLAATNGFLEEAVDVGNGTLPLFVTRPLSEILFGHADTLMATLATLTGGAVPAAYPGLLPNASEPPHAAGLGTDRMYTGALTSFRAWEMQSVGGQHSIWCCIMGPCGAAGPQGYGAHPAWGSGAANRVRGAEYLQFRAGLQAGDTVPTFHADIPRCARAVHGCPSPSLQ